MKENEINFLTAVYMLIFCQNMPWIAYEIIVWIQ